VKSIVSITFLKQSVRLLGWVIRLSQGRTTQTQNTPIQISIPLVGFETTIPVFERKNIFHASDRAASLFGTLYQENIFLKKIFRT
jgi:hypothetical protein